MNRIHRHNYESRFTIISNDILENEYLSFGAKALLCYMLSRPADWVIYRGQLAKVYKGDKRGNGKNAVDSWFNELMEFGYVVYTAKDEETGKFIHRYDVYPEPDPDFQKKIPKRVKPVMGKTPHGLNTPQQRNNSSQRKEGETKEGEKKKGKKKSSAPASRSASASPPTDSKESKPPPDPRPQKKLIEHGSHVKLTEEEYRELCEAEGKQETDEMIEDMNDWCQASKPKGYANYNAALRKWFRKNKRDVQQKKRERKFAPCSDDKKAYEALKEMDKYAL